MGKVFLECREENDSGEMFRKRKSVASFPALSQHSRDMTRIKPFLHEIRSVFEISCVVFQPFSTCPSAVCSHAIVFEGQKKHRILIHESAQL
jgi:hypothetical protein